MSLVCLVLIIPFVQGAPSSVDPALVQKIETYLNGIKSYRATIAQQDAHGNHQTGHVYMLRDGVNTFGKMRIEYNPPMNNLIVVDGKDFIFYDAQAKEANAYDIDATPAAFLLRRHIDLQGDLQVIHQTKNPDGTVHLKIIRQGDDSGAALTLQFSTVPLLKLNGWSITDPQGLTTHVQLTDVNIGMPLDPNLFVYKGK